MRRDGRTSKTSTAPERRPGLLAAAAGIAALAVAAVGGGVYAASTTDEPPPPPATEQTGPVADGTPQGPVTNIARAGNVAALKRVVPPDVFVVGAGPIDQDKIKKISKIKKVRDVIAVPGGAVQLQGVSINAFAVDPSRFRSWTPPGTAKNDQLWTALAADQFVVSAAAAEELQLSKGFPYPVVGRTMPRLLMGGAGSLGLPGIDLLVHKKTGKAMGLVPNVAVLVNAPGVPPAKTAEQVGKILGGQAKKVINLHDPKYQAPAGGGRPAGYMDLYKQAAKLCPGLSWTVLAAIGQVESDHGRNAGRSSAGALGPMQFMPATWKSYGVDGDGDGKADIMNPYDAIPAASKYLCAHGASKGGQSLYKAIWHYNHADWYVRKVLGVAQAYQSRYQ